MICLLCALVPLIAAMAAFAAMLEAFAQYGIPRCLFLVRARYLAVLATVSVIVTACGCGACIFAVRQQRQQCRTNRPDDDEEKEEEYHNGDHQPYPRTKQQYGTYHDGYSNGPSAQQQQEANDDYEEYSNDPQTNRHYDDDDDDDDKRRADPQNHARSTKNWSASFDQQECSAMEGDVQDLRWTFNSHHLDGERKDSFASSGGGKEGMKKHNLQSLSSLDVIMPPTADDGSSVPHELSSRLEHGLVPNPSAPYETSVPPKYGCRPTASSEYDNSVESECEHRVSEQQQYREDMVSEFENGENGPTHERHQPYYFLTMSHIVVCSYLGCMGLLHQEGDIPNRGNIMRTCETDSLFIRARHSMMTTTSLQPELLSVFTDGAAFTMVDESLDVWSYANPFVF